MKCEVCGKAYKSRSGLRRHMKSVHGGAASPGEVARNEQASQAGPTLAGQSPSVKEAAEGAVLREACKALGIKSKDVMAFKVYEDKVVIIEGPTGWKRVWERATEDGRERTCEAEG